MVSPWIYNEAKLNHWKQSESEYFYHVPWDHPWIKFKVEIHWEGRRLWLKRLLTRVTQQAFPRPVCRNPGFTPNAYYTVLRPQQTPWRKAHSRVHIIQIRCPSFSNSQKYFTNLWTRVEDPCPSDVSTAPFQGLHKEGTATCCYHLPVRTKLLSYLTLLCLLLGQISFQQGNPVNYQAKQKN